ncbi:hypothetical protein BCR42DRAFT_444611 [Absidia repens]|uniref:Uncharacterized protein n=1 Tax=Absidia repens TaxID=90262 RepID=A0A1X2HKH5_9FUNG|nr:hypothetical protein BCR42DRAFT_444611 [Absidia repens]
MVEDFASISNSNFGIDISNNIIATTTTTSNSNSNSNNNHHTSSSSSLLKLPPKAIVRGRPTLLQNVQRVPITKKTNQKEHVGIDFIADWKQLKTWNWIKATIHARGHFWKRENNFERGIEGDCRDIYHELMSFVEIRHQFEFSRNNGTTVSFKLVIDHHEDPSFQSFFDENGYENFWLSCCFFSGQSPASSTTSSKPKPVVSTVSLLSSPSLLPLPLPLSSPVSPVPTSPLPPVPSVMLISLTPTSPPASSSSVALPHSSSAKDKKPLKIRLNSDKIKEKRTEKQENTPKKKLMFSP